MKDVDVRSKARENFLNSAVDLLLSGDISERCVAASVLGKLGDVEVMHTLLQVLQEDSNRTVQHKVAQAIARIGGTQAVHELQQMMRDGQAYTRFLAAETLADIVARGNDKP